ncbi:hypothetical protein QW131_18440 [Roseibium salinum]|nr:hypothetical protein [Roseibium salinum]
MNAASLLTAVILLVALVFSWTTVSKLRQINAELGELKKLEERIVGKINLMNTGFSEPVGTDGRPDRGFTVGVDGGERDAAGNRRLYRGSDPRHQEKHACG